VIDWAEWGNRFAESGDKNLRNAFVVAVALSLVLPRLPFGRNLLYPFALLSTWAHELGHGVTAVLVGGRFDRLEVHSNLNGLAYSSRVGPLGQAIVAAGGLLAPAAAGGLVIVLGSRPETAPWVLTGLAAVLVASVLLVVRNGFGWMALSAMGAGLVAIALYAPVELRIFIAQLIGIQFAFASWGSLNYMFTKSFIGTDGRRINSDTQNIAQVLILPYWFWGAIIALISLSIVALSFYLAWLRPVTG